MNGYRNYNMSVKILLIDDETDYSETVGFWLMANGYQVRTASMSNIFTDML